MAAKLKWALVGIAVAVISFLAALLFRRSPKDVKAQALEETYSRGLKETRQRLADLQASGAAQSVAAASLEVEIKHLEVTLASQLTNQGLSAEAIAERLKRLSLTLLVVLTATCMLLAASPARAQVPMVHEGVEGVWLPAGKAEALLHLAEAEPTQQQLLAKQREEIALLKLRVTTATTAESLARAALTEADLRGNRWKAEAETACSKPVYESPYLNFVFGLVAGGTAAVSICRATR